MGEARIFDSNGIAKPTMLISIELYTQLIEQIGYLKGRNTEIEKQLNQEMQQEILGETDEIRYLDNKPYNITKLTIKNILEREIRRLEGLKREDAKKDGYREITLRTDGKIEGLKYAIDKLFEI